ncbi:MAG: FAD-dependent oxidoreductase, partial [Thermotogaceae bacterium]|nr:FAD-dependent oxidoreductase [Thermotogaceae bacterium]
IYINSREVLDEFLRLKKNERIFFVGQLTGVEGYLESAATGLYVGYTIKKIAEGKTPVPLPRKTMLGSLIHYITKGAIGKLKPMYANFGLFPDVGVKDKKKKKRVIAEVALDEMKKFVNGVG